MLAIRLILAAAICVLDEEPSRGQGRRSRMRRRTLPQLQRSPRSRRKNGFRYSTERT